MLDLRTINDIFERACAGNNPQLIRWKDKAGSWQDISSAKLRRSVMVLAGALSRWGIGKGDRIAILSENRWEWAVTDFATLALGAVDVPIYPTLTADQIAFMLADSGARVAVVSTADQFRKVQSIRSMTALEHVVVMDEAAGNDAASFAELLRGEPMNEVEFAESAQAVRGDDLATIIYTSGTTGTPKGVMLTHFNIASNLNYSTALFNWNKSVSCISFLPLSHITARALDYAVFCRGATIAYCPRFEDVPQTMRTIHPKIVVAVPRVYEKTRQEVERRSAESGLRKRMLRWAVGVGHAHRSQILQGKTPTALGWKLANKLVFSKIRQAFGGEVVHFISGGAPLGMETAGWFADVSIRIFEGYGLTETSPVIALNNEIAHRIGTVGKPVTNIELRLAPDGELLVRGPSIFKGYWHNEQATREAIDEQGWFATGDIARMDEDGFLSIVDRKKELLKTSGGKFVAPQPIENKLKANLLVGQAALVGDKHKFVSVLISPNFAALEAWAKGQGLAESNRTTLIAQPKVIAEYERVVSETNESLANFEKLKRVRLVAHEWSLETGELTPSLKLKRRVIEERYAAEILQLYSDEATTQSDKLHLAKH